MSISVKLTGAGELQRELQRLMKEAPDAMADALLEEAHALGADSVPLTPLKRGRLRNSRFVELKKGKNPEATVGYDTEYAVHVHERTELRHPVGQAKFLQEPFERRQSGYFERLAARAKQFLRIKG
jgi:hypothetical protein